MAQIGRASQERSREILDGRLRLRRRHTARREIHEPVGACGVVTNEQVLEAFRLTGDQPRFIMTAFMVFSLEAWIPVLAEAVREDSLRKI